VGGCLSYGGFGNPRRGMTFPVATGVSSEPPQGGGTVPPVGKIVDEPGGYPGRGRPASTACGRN
jgi:hypothetical protein